MTIDLLGPGSTATNVTTTRPVESRAFGALDTWFQDCTSPAAGDGTRVPAAWLNAIKAQLVQAIRQSGVTQDNADDLMLWKAIQAAVVAGMPSVTGTLVGVQFLTSSGTYTPSSGATKALVFAQGAGGGGSGSSSYTLGGGSHAGAGGGGGALAIAVVSLSGVSSVTCTIGAGGSGAAGSSNAGAGGTTAFGTYAVAGGGSGAYGASGAGAGRNGGSAAGGAASAGNVAMLRGAASQAPSGSYPEAMSGAGGLFGYGGGLGGEIDPSLDNYRLAQSGVLGGGGGGGDGSQTGASGGAGCILIFEFK